MTIKEERDFTLHFICKLMHMTQDDQISWESPLTLNVNSLSTTSFLCKHTESFPLPFTILINKTGEDVNLSLIEQVNINNNIYSRTIFNFPTTEGMEDLFRTIQFFSKKENNVNFNIKEIVKSKNIKDIMNSLIRMEE